jgi:hypothetical protein
MFDVTEGGRFALETRSPSRPETPITRVGFILGMAAPRRRRG